MDWLIKLFTNPILVAGLASWTFAQVLKMIIYAAVNKKLDWGRLFGDGGMPSGHSATVTAVAVMTGLRHGFDSPELAISAILAIVVCHDATGVRYETGKQAILVNEMVRILEIMSGDELPEVKLKEFVGHTPLQVYAGVAIGVANALLMHFLVFK